MTTASATLDSMPSPARPDEGASPIVRYGRLWKRLPRDLGYLGLLAVLLLTGYALLYTLFWAGVGLIGAVVGIFLIIASLWGARWLGALELVRIRWAQPQTITPPDWNAKPEANAFMRFFTVLGNPHYWLYLLHGMVVLPILGIVTITITFSWLVTALAAVVAPAVAWAIPGVHFGFDEIQDGRYVHIPLPLAILISVVSGLVLTALLPFVVRGFVFVHYQVDRLMLGAFRTKQLQQQVTDLAASRTAAVAAEGSALRRLERDIHDGPQQRLVRLQMDLAAAQRQLPDDAAAARELIDGAMAQSKEALEELRALSQGFAPPILLDRGLVAALESLVARSNVTVGFTNLIEPGVDLPQELSRNAYFIASELLTNVAKHSRATEVGLTIELRRVPETDATWLDVIVTDNGHGGAAATPGHGLAGLEERVRGLGGVLVISSPAGGPTVATANLPVTLG